MVETRDENCANLIQTIDIQVSISSTFYAILNFAPIFLHQKITKPNVTREKLLNSPLYEILACKMLMKLTPSVASTKQYFKIKYVGS